MQVTFYFIRRHRLRNFPRGLGYTLLHGGEAGMSPAELRALPVRAPAADACRWTAMASLLVGLA